MKAEDGEQAADGIGHQHGDIFFTGRQGRDLAAENETPHHQAVVACRVALDVLDHQMLSAMRGAGIEHGLKQRAAGVRGAEHHVGHHIIELVGLVFAQCRAPKAFRRIEFHRRQKRQRDPGKPLEPKLAAHARERCELRTVDPDGQHAGFAHLGDGAGAFIDFHQGAGDGQAAFRENHHLAALFQLFHQHAQRHRVGGINRDHVEERETKARPPGFGDMGVDGETGAVGQEGREQRAIEQRGVIGDDDGFPSGGAEILHAFHLDAVEQAENLARHRCYEFLRQQPADPDGGAAVANGQQQEEALRRHHFQQRGGGQSRGDHEDGVDDIVGGNDPRAPRRIGALLHDGIERYGIDAAEEGNEKQIDADAPTRPVRKEG